jgi:hypothetical protein
MPNVGKEEFESLHQKVDRLAEDTAEIKGMLKERCDSKRESISIIGIITAVGLGIFNLIK